MSDPIAGDYVYVETEEVLIKAEPLDMDYDDASFVDEVEQDTPSPEPYADWRPIKIESIMNNFMNTQDDDSEEETKPVIQKKKLKKGKMKSNKQVTPKKIQKIEIKQENSVMKSKTVKPKRPKPKPEEIGDEFMCSKCSKRCVNLAGLSSHYTRCGNSTNTLSNIVKSNEGIYCSDCGKIFKDVRGAKVHRLYCNQAQVGPSFIKQDDDTYILQETQYICDICGVKFRLKSRIKQHMILEHSADSNFSCEICGKRSFAKSIHEIHMRTHLDQKDRPYPCMQCTKNFKAKAELQKHIYGVHIPAEEKPSFGCDECTFVTCKQEFLFKHKINKHMPDNEKPFQCETCSKGFITDKEFDRHLKTHTNQKVHSCPECERTFKTNAEMKEHYVKDHTDDKPFVCDICQKAMNHRHQYRRHLRNHEKELGMKLDKSVRKFNIRLEDYLPQQQK